MDSGPEVIPGYPVQVSDLVLPAHGVGLILATDPDPRLLHGAVAVPPLPEPGGSNGWTVGSARGGAPYLEILWFRADGATFIASAKIGSGASAVDIKALGGIIQSLKPG